MRVALITEATYPYVRSGVSTWCHQLCSGLDGHTFDVITVTAGERVEPVYRTPANVTSVRAVPVSDRPDPPAGRMARIRHRRGATTAAVLLCRGLLGDGPHEAAMFRDGLRQLTMLAVAGHPLHGVPLEEILLDAWHAASGAATQDTGDFRLPLPRLSLRDAHAVAAMLDHAIRPLAARLPEVDISHPVGAGLPLLVALAAKWRAGTPFLLTEHGIYLRERYLEGGAGLPVAVKAATLRFYRALSRLGYAEAALIASVSRFNQRWELRHGAHPARVVIVPNGVDPAAYPPLPEGSAPPTVGWVGRIGPGRDLHTLIRAFHLVRRRVPAARLRLSGPVAEGQESYAASCHELVRRLDLADAVTVTGPVRSSLEAYAHSHLAALSSVAEGMPYTVIEAMMCGRPTVATDVGAVAELVGDAGLVVPAGDPAAFAEACAGLLTDPRRRQRLATSGRRRALEHFTLSGMLRAYEGMYHDVRAAGPPEEDTLPLPIVPGAAVARVPTGARG
jgi:glycosyltransferase involved in cell wall biosynthesis